MRQTMNSLLAVAFTLILSGCITTTEGGRDPVDEKKAEQTFIDAGFAYLRNRDKDSARRHFLRALDLNRSSAGALNGMALIYEMDEEVDKADSHFRRAISLDPGNSMARNNYANFLYQQSRYTDAEKQLKVVIRDDKYPRRFIALMSLGRTMLKLQKEDEAIKYLRQSLSLNPTLTLANLELSEIFFSRKDYPSAKFYLDQYDRYKRGRPTAASLLLKIRLERIFGNKDQEASAVLALKNMYPYSDEYLEYKETLIE